MQNTQYFRNRLKMAVPFFLEAQDETETKMGLFAVIGNCGIAALWPGENKRSAIHKATPGAVKDQLM